MFRALILISAIFFFFSARAQHTADAKDGDREFNQYQALYKTALSYNDTATMLTGLMGMVSIRAKDTTCLKILGRLYAAQQKYSSAVIACKKYLDIVVDNVEVLQLEATSAQNAFNYDYALLLYTELYYRTKNPQYKYFAAYMEYELYRKEDCLKTINFCLQIPSAETTMLNVKSADGKSQQVPLKAVCMHLMGLEYVDAKELDKAKNAFGEALKLFPNFIEAQKSLIEFNNKQQNK